jgi:toxin ParE1/3/4
MPRIVRTPRCDRDLFEIAVYIGRDNPAAADNLIDTIDEKFSLLAQFPRLGRDRSELADDMRSFPVGNYVIFYRALRDGIIVLRVLHGARNLRRIFRRRK